MLKVSVKPNSSAVVKKIVNNIANNQGKLYSIPRKQIFLYGPPNNGKAIPNEDLVNFLMTKHLGTEFNTSPSRHTMFSINNPQYLDDKVLDFLKNSKFPKIVDFKDLSESIQKRFGMKIEIKNPLGK